MTGGWGGGDEGGSDGCIVVWLLNFNAPSTPQGHLRTNKHFLLNHTFKTCIRANERLSNHKQERLTILDTTQSRYVHFVEQLAEDICLL